MKRIIFAVFLIASPAFAQTDASPEVQALGNKLMEEINSNVQLRVKVIQLEARVRAITEENSKLKVTPEKKP